MQKKRTWIFSERLMYVQFTSFVQGEFTEILKEF